MGTIEKYDATAKALTVKDANGTTHVFSLSNARTVKSEKITQQQLSTLLSNTGIIVLVIGQQAATDTIKAQTLIVLQPNVGGMNGTSPTGTPRANRTPWATRVPGRTFASLKNVKLSGNQLVGTNATGKTITVDLSGTPTIFEESVAADNDFQTGQAVTVTATFSKPNDARMVIIGERTPMAGNQAQ